MPVERKEAQGLEGWLNQIVQREGKGLAFGKGGELSPLEKGRQLQNTELKHSCFLQRE